MKRPRRCQLGDRRFSSVAQLDRLLERLYGDKARRGGALALLMHRAKGGPA